MMASQPSQRRLADQERLDENRREQREQDVQEAERRDARVNIAKKIGKLVLDAVPTILSNWP